MSESCLTACANRDETRRILGELQILVDMIRVYVERMFADPVAVEGAPVYN